MTDVPSAVERALQNADADGEHCTFSRHPDNTLYLDIESAEEIFANRRTLAAEARRLAAEMAGVRAALETAVRVADEALQEWDKAPEGMRPGKLLLALCTRRLHYRDDITAMHAARSALQPAPEGKRAKIGTALLSGSRQSKTVTCCALRSGAVRSTP